MIYNNTYIYDIDYHTPDLVMTSKLLEKELKPVYSRLKLPEGRIELMTGIIERRYWDKGVKSSTIATTAAKKLLKKTNFDKRKIDLLIHASVCRDFLEPATASIVHASLGLNDNCLFFDLSNACLGVINAIMMAANGIENGSYKNVLIVSGENSGPLLLDTINFLNSELSLTRKTIKKYFANLTIGSAGVALLMGNEPEVNQKHQLLSESTKVDSSASILCQGDGNTESLMMETNSEELMKKGISFAKSNWDKLDNKHWDYALTHQVGIAHQKLLSDSLLLNKYKTYITYDYFGNTGSAALPLTLAKLIESGNLKKDDKIAMLGIGSGLTCSILGLKW